MLGFLAGLFTGVLAYKVYSAYWSKGNTTSTKSLTANGASTATSTTDRSLNFLAQNAAAAADADQRTGSFLTDVIASLWSHVNAAVSAEIQNTAEPMFREMLPGPLKSLHFTKCSLGNVPLRLDNAIVHPCQKHSVTGKDYVRMEMDVVWDGRCDIELKADYIGKLGVQHLKLAGRLSFLLQPLTEKLPVVTAVQFGFVNPPQLELDFTGLASVADIKTLKTTIQKTIADIIASMMVLPNRMLTKLDENQSYFGAYQPPLGVARLSIVKGRGFTEEKRKLRKADVPDVYCVVSLGGTEIWTTSVVQDSTEPVWKDETADVLLDDYNQVLTVRVWDRDEGALDSDDDLGRATLTVGDLLLAGGKIKEVELQDDGGRGLGAYISMHCDLLKLEPKLQSIEQNANSLNEHMYNGLLTILLSEATVIPAPPGQQQQQQGEESKEDGTVEPELYFVKATYGQESYFTAAVDGQAAVFNKAFRIPLIDCADLPSVRLALYKGPEATLEACEQKKSPNVLVGEFEIKHEDIWNAPLHSVSANRPVSDNKSGPCLEYSIFMRGLTNSSGEPVTESLRPTTTTPTSPSLDNSQDSQLTVTIVKGWGFKAQTRRLKPKDIPDVYCKLQFGSSPTVFRTQTKKNNFAPFWEESKTYHLKGHSQVLKIEAWDEDGGHKDPDDFLGKARISVGKILLAGGSYDVELLNEGKRTGYYLALKCRAGDANAVSSAPSEDLPAVTASGSSENDDASEPELISKEEVISSRSLMADATPKEAESITVKITAVKGAGFQVEKRRFGRRGDVPDVYCKISVESSKDKVWRTSTIENNLNPAWGESKTFTTKNDLQVVSIEVFDEDSGKTDMDDFLGQVKTPLKTLLSAKDGTKDLALLDKNGSNTGCTLTLCCAVA
mmetsp:Transcript_16962/g.37044  ORF Transcript_16962/g.37044 Transcript_16962/m.37044 type:complete len:896 (+) Transcript_16962:122-2809(+)|eukprot:CAMPEP_0168749686 /NCGR_PEP_ID=MMETSP0724-20121128/16850_1 /TAXON_ID=265536 /ORGANISM="Amphiprora sp., Strain CCMP467" /LENGTH=895 /DNA_ID=CAMNT_0008797615 /DNA_START=83 /DNA_END=2770 /DNA_ORIENTATION=+